MGTLEAVALGLAIAEGVTKGVKTAIEAKAAVEKMVAEGREPTAEEWAKLNAVTEAAHEAIQKA